MSNGLDLAAESELILFYSNYLEVISKNDILNHGKNLVNDYFDKNTKFKVVN